MRIAFVHLGREHLGIEYLSSILKQHGHETVLAYDPGLFGQEDNVFYIPYLERIFSKKKKVLQEIRRSAPDIVAFSVYTSTYPWALDIAKIVKQEMGLKTVFGGIHASLVPDFVIQDPSVDFLIVGEGEHSLLELVQAVAAGNTKFEIPNVWYKENGNIVKNRHRPAISNLDELPFPDKAIFQDHINYRDEYVIMTSRGCLFNCSYCCDSFLNDMYEHKYSRRRSVASVMEELKLMKGRYGFRRVMFFDSILFSNKKWMAEFLPVYKEEIRVPFRCTGHISLADQELLIAMKEAGCYCIDFGVQSFNEDVRKKLLNRMETNEKIDRVFSICDQIRLRYDVDLIMGLPLVTEDDYRLPLELMQKHKYFNRLKTYNLTYYPSLELIPKAQKLGAIDSDDIQRIQRGEVGDFFHNDTLKDDQMKRMKDNFTIAYKLYPLLPAFLKTWMLRKRLYRFFFYIPGFVVIILQVFNGILKSDYRFYIYIHKYLIYFKRQLGMLLRKPSAVSGSLNHP